MPKAWAGCDQLTDSLLFEVRNLLKTGDNSWALFLGHLVLEKLLKAHYVKTLGKHAIFTHDLLRLATKTGMNLTDIWTERIEILRQWLIKEL